MEVIACRFQWPVVKDAVVFFRDNGVQLLQEDDNQFITCMISSFRLWKLE